MILVQTPSSDLIPLYKLGIVKNISASVDRPGHEKLVPWKRKEKKLDSKKEAKETVKRLSIWENKIKCQNWKIPWLTEIFLSFCLISLSNPSFLFSDLFSYLSMNCFASVRKRKFIVGEISLFRAIRVDYGVAQHSVRTDHKKAAGASI